MKICMLAYSFYETDNRVRRYAETLAQRGDHVDAIVLRKKGHAKRTTLNDVNLYKIQQRTINEKGKLSYLFKMIGFFVNSTFFLIKSHLRNHYDIIHIHSVPDFLVFVAFLPKILGAKIILDIHDIVPEFYSSKFDVMENSIGFRALLLVEKISIAFADHVIIANHLWYKKLVSRADAKEKCTVILNYPDPRIFNQMPMINKNGDFILFYAGSFQWHQGLDVSIKAVANLKDKMPNLKYHIYGEGSTKQELLDLVEELGLEEKVYIKNEIPIDQIPACMAVADVGVVPKRKDSFGNEAFSTKILEFMAAGIPTIASKTKIDQYYFDDSILMFSESGDSENLAQCIYKLYKNKKKRQVLVDRAKQFASKNNWGEKKEQYFTILNKLIK